MKVEISSLIINNFYSPGISKFAEPDTLILNFYNPQSLNLYSYTLNNPLKYTDPTGHRPIIDEDEYGNPIVNPDWRPGGRRGKKEIEQPSEGVTQDEHERLVAIREYALLMIALMRSEKITDVKASAMILDHFAPIYGQNVNGMLRDLGIVIGGLDFTFYRGQMPYEIGREHRLSQYYVGYDAFVPPDDKTGFGEVLNPNGHNQVRHFFAGAAGGRLGPVAQSIMLDRERSDEDIALYEQAFAFVDYLQCNGCGRRGGYVPPMYPGNWVLIHLQ